MACWKRETWQHVCNYLSISCTCNLKNVIDVLAEGIQYMRSIRVHFQSRLKVLHGEMTCKQQYLQNWPSTWQHPHFLVDNDVLPVLLVPWHLYDKVLRFLHNMHRALDQSMTAEHTFDVLKPYKEEGSYQHKNPYHSWICNNYIWDPFKHISLQGVMKCELVQLMQHSSSVTF